MSSAAPQSQAEWEQRLTNREVTVGVIGLGYVGLPLVLAFIDKGFRVVGVDINEKLVEQLRAGKSPIRHIPGEAVAAALENGFTLSTEAAAISEADAVILCVPTPLGPHHEPDLKAVISSVRAAVPHLKSGALLSLESTTYPGTTEEEVMPLLSEGGRKVGEDFYLVYSPEREDPGRKTHTTATIPKLCGGVTEACLARGLALYSEVIQQVVPVSSPAVAEMAKLLENIFRSVNIGLVNELKILADRMGIDIYQVIEAAATKPYGFTPFYPGPGIGGHCIPVDPFYLTWKAREYGLHTRFIELSGEINRAMPEWVVNKLIEALNERSLALKGAKILVLGVAYKANVDDLRESPALDVIALLQHYGADVSYHDPWVPVMQKTRKQSFGLESQALTPTMLESQDAVLLVTHHQDVDYSMVLEHARLIIDTRRQLPADHPHVVPA